MASARLRSAASPEKAGLRAAELASLREGVDELPSRGWCSGVVVLAGRGRHIALEHAAGWAVRYAGYDPATDGGIALPDERRQPVTTDTLFDLASLTKLFTAIAAMQQCERGALDLEREAAAYVPEFGAHGKARITVRELLTHTSGLRPELPLGERPEAPLTLLWEEEPLSAPGTAHRYSDLNLIALQQVLERITGRGLDALVRDGITAPLGMHRTSYGPVPPEAAAATEDQRRPWAKADRGMLRGTVHDENAHALGGVAGHAGLFSTAGDLAVLCRTLLTGGAYGPARVLTPSSVAQRQRGVANWRAPQARRRCARPSGGSSRCIRRLRRGRGCPPPTWSRSPTCWANWPSRTGRRWWRRHCALRPPSCSPSPGRRTATPVSSRRATC